MVGLNPWVTITTSDELSTTPGVDPATLAWQYLNTHKFSSNDLFGKGTTMRPKKHFDIDEAVAKGIIIPYANYSRGAKELAREIGMVRARDSEQVYMRQIPLTDNLAIINWGCFEVPKFTFVPGKYQVVINDTGIRECADKVKFFETMKKNGSVRIPEFTKSLEEALAWVKKGEIVFGRQARGSGGTDIVLYDESPDRFADSSFFSLYKKKKDEFRVHIVDGEVILVQRKAVRDTDDAGDKIDKSKVNFQIRNHKNGFIFKRYDIHVPDDVISQARKAVSVAALDFGAVDVVYNSHEDRAYVLEINTAPGLEGTTVSDYATALKKLVKKRLDAV